MPRKGNNQAKRCGIGTCLSFPRSLISLKGPLSPPPPSISPLSFSLFYHPPRYPFFHSPLFHPINSHCLLSPLSLLLEIISYTLRTSPYVPASPGISDAEEDPISLVDKAEGTKVCHSCVHEVLWPQNNCHSKTITYRQIDLRPNLSTLHQANKQHTKFSLLIDTGKRQESREKDQ